ncbi:hypothetical protein B0H63DRAFT_456900 [Podospora didyma]|uniref:Secreted protein n=1 Tax=Podospora didyma TaxID=330526 RepID=A0AAE0U6Q8_9PEZI|nr:hypothetical protein B0H63DRAFT_456900 [Podospora didyma]
MVPWRAAYFICQLDWILFGLLPCVSTNRRPLSMSDNSAVNESSTIHTFTYVYAHAIKRAVGSRRVLCLSTLFIVLCNQHCLPIVADYK